MEDDVAHVTILGLYNALKEIEKMAAGEPVDPKKILNSSAGPGFFGAGGFFGSGGAGGSGGVYSGDVPISGGWSTVTTAVNIGPQENLETATLRLVSDTVSLPCSFCGSTKTGQFVFNDKDNPEVRLCSGCLTKSVAWVIAQAQGGLPIKEGADRAPCAKCHRHFQKEHLHVVGKKTPVVLCDPCLDQFAEEMVQSQPRRNIVL
jgi:hypothetical protein